MGELTCAADVGALKGTRKDPEELHDVSRFCWERKEKENLLTFRIFKT